jgi:hypothetical protein
MRGSWTPLKDGLRKRAAWQAGIAQAGVVETEAVARLAELERGRCD